MGTCAETRAMRGSSTSVTGSGCTKSELIIKVKPENNPMVEVTKDALNKISAPCEVSGGSCKQEEVLVD